MKVGKRAFILLIFLVILTFLCVSCGSKDKDVFGSSSEKDILQENKVSKKEYSKNQKVVFLTFDDGPSKNTEKILDILKSENVKATFFVNGHDDDFSIKMYKRIVEEGHTIANHTYSHSYKDVYKSQENFVKDIEKLNDFIYSITGVKPDILRFPGGSNNTINRKFSGSSDNGFMEGLANRIEDEGFAYFDWTVDSTDASKMKQDVEKIVSSTLAESMNQKYPVVLFHDAPAKTTTVEALPRIIKALKDSGYLIDNLTKDVPVNSRFLKGENGEILK